jgi:hypothetical protein
MIGEKSLSRNYSFAEVEYWWKWQEFENKNPQHPFAYAKAAAITYRAAIDAIRKDRPLVKWRPKGGVGVAYIHPNCSSKTEEKVSKWFKPNR